MKTITNRAVRAKLFVKSGLLSAAFALIGLQDGHGASNDVQTTFNAGATDLSVGTNYTANINPAAAGLDDIELTGPYTGGTVFTVNGAALVFGSLNDIDLTQPLVITNTNTTAGSITLNRNAAGNNNITSTGNVADLLYVKAGANLTIQSGAGAATNTLNLAGSGNIDTAGTLSLAGPITITPGTTVAFTGAATGNTTIGGTITGATGGITFGQAGTVTDNGGITTTTGGLTFNGAGTTTLSGAFTSTSGGLAFSGAGNSIISGNISNTTGGLTVGTAGTVTLSGADSYTGATAINSGTLLLDFSAVGAPAVNIINHMANSSAVTLANNGSLTIKGANGGTNSQQFNGLALSGTGASNVITFNQNGATSLGASLGTITRSNVGETLDIVLPTAGAVTTSATTGSTNGILTSVNGGTAYATANGGATWATNNAGTLGALSTYQTDYTNSASNIDVGATDAPAAGFTVNTLRFNGANTLTASGANVVTTGGILVTAAGTGSVLTGGSITAGATGKELVVFNEGAGHTFNIASSITDNGTNKVALTLAGGGTTTLSGSNTFTGGVNLTSGNLVVGNTGAFNSTAGAADVLNFGYGSTGTLTLGGNSIVLGGLNSNSTSAGSSIVQNGSATKATLTIGDSQNLNSTYNGLLQNGAGTGSLSVVKAGTGNFSLQKTATYTGTTTINGGQFILSAANLTNSTVIVNAGGIITASYGNGGGSSTTSWSGALSGMGGFNDSQGNPNAQYTMNTANTYTGITENTNRGVLAAGLSSALSGGNYVSGPFGVNSAFIDGAGQAILYLGGFNVELGSLSASVVSTSAGIILDSTTTAGTLVTGGDNTNTTFGNSISDGKTALQGSGGLTGYNGLAAGGKLVKIGTGTQTLSGTNSYTGSTTINGGTLLFANEGSLYNATPASWTAANIIVNAGGTLGLSVGGTGQFTTADLTTLITNLDGSVTTGGLLAGSALALDTTTAAGGTFTLANVLADTTGTGGGSVGLTKLGVGTLVLTGADTYSGQTTIAAGTLQVGNGTTGSILSSTVITDNGTLAFDEASGSTQTISNAITGSGALTQLGAGATTVLLGANAYTGATTITAGTLQLGNGTTNGTLATGSAIVDNGTLTFDEATGAIQGTDFSNAPITGTGNVTVEGPGAVTFNQNNAFGSLTDSGIVNVGTVAANGVAQPLGEGPITLAGTSSSTGVINYTGGNGSLGNNITVATGDQGSIVNSGGLLTLSGNIDKTASVLNFVGGTTPGSFNVTGHITGSSGTPNSDLNIVNTTVTLSNTNTYNGPTTISGNPSDATVSGSNKLITAVAGALPTANPSVVTLGSTALETNTLGYTNILDLDGTAQTVAALNSVNDSPTGTVVDVNEVINSNIGTPSTLTIAPTAGTTTTYGGTVGDVVGNTANIAVVVNGSATGTQQFTGANTYTQGTTVTSGKLQAGNVSALGTGPVVVNGGILQGTVANVSFLSLAMSSGVLDTNATGTGTFSLTGSANSFALTGGTWELDIAGGTNDMVTGISTANFTISGTTLDLSGDTLVIGQQYTILTGFGSGTGTFGAITGYDTGAYLVTFDDTTTAGVGVLTVSASAAPEPSTWAMLLGGVVLLVTIQRRRRAARF